MEDTTVVIRGGRLVDGTGSPWRYADVVIKDGRIAAVMSPGRVTSAGRVIDATGHVVAPGFIDVHSHSDLALLAKPGAEEKLRQGVTTEVVGNCGISVTPANSDAAEQQRARALPILGFPDVPWDWTNVSSYLRQVAAQRPAVNVATFVGLGSLRCAVTGLDSRAPSQSERRLMRTLLRDSLRQGAVGLSSGLVYAPGSYMSPEEIWELTADVAQAGALYSTHMRDQGNGFLRSVEESIEVGRRTGVAVQIAHHKVVGPRNWGQTAESLRLVDEARASGIDVGSDVYPYLAGSTTMTALLPSWVVAGGRQAMLERLQDAQARAEIRRAWASESTSWDNRVATLGFENIVISSVGTADNRDLVGLSVAGAAAARGHASPADYLMDLLVQEDGSVGNIQLACSEDDLRRVMTHATTCFGSDGLHIGGRQHPRLRGTFPRILGEYVRDRDVLPLEQAVRKMTSQPARRLGLEQVGMVERGYRADVVVFDPETIAGPATYEHPGLPPVGVRYVFVGGALAVEDGEATGVRAGQALRRIGTGTES